MRRLAGLLLLALLGGCAGKTPKTPAPEPAMDAPRAAAAAGAAPAAAGVPPACVQVREHRDEDYTPGGLYAPGVRDSAPQHALDVSGIPEPEPRDEAPSAYGNRTPYTVLGKTYRVLPRAEGYVERGVASWYGQKFHGRQTSSREVYDMCSFSAAHKTLPLPSVVRVTNLDNGRSVVVRVNDRGPFHAGRIIDLSYAAAVKLGVDRTGTANVEVRALSGGAVAGTASAAVPAPAPVAARPAATGDRQLIQVGAYREKDNARRVANQLEDAGIEDVRIEDVRTDAGKVWRVRIGPLKAKDVDGVLARLRGLGLGSPRVFSE